MTFTDMQMPLIAYLNTTTCVQLHNNLVIIKINNFQTKNKNFLIKIKIDKRLNLNHNKQER